MTAMIVAAAMMLAAVGTRFVSGQQSATTRPALAALDRELQTLFDHAKACTVRAQVPVHLSTEHPLVKWRAQLDPKLQEQVARGDLPRLYLEPTTAPATAPALGRTATQSNNPEPSASARLTVEFVGLVLNDRGDVLLPLHVDERALDGRSISVSFDEASATTARIIATDRKTSLTVIRMEAPSGKPVRFAGSRPAEGALVLLVSPVRRHARVGLWAGGEDENAIVFNREGEVAGIVRNGHGLYTSTLMPIIEQLSAGREVRRAELGVKIRAVPADDARRIEQPALGSRPAARVEEVKPGSAAAKGGLRQGDVILSLAGEPVEDIVTFAAAIANRRGTTELQILRDGAERTLTVDLQPR